MNLENSLARFKKRKWGTEKPKSNDAKKDDAPPTEPDTPPTEPDTPPTEPDTPKISPKETKQTVEDFEDKSATKKLTDRLFWMRIVFAVIGGIIATFAFEDIVDMEEKRWTSIGFMIMLFIATAIIAKSWKIRIQNKKKYVTTGIGSFVFLYLFSWIVSYTFMYVGTTSPSIIPFP